MSMSRKHFVALAKIIADERAVTLSSKAEVSIDATMYRLASFCAENSSTFDRTRFIQAASEGRPVETRVVKTPKAK